MANNLFISYDLADPDRNFEALATEIEKLGVYAQVHPTLWYAHTDQSSEQVCQALWAVLDKENDMLMVIDASNNTAHWENLDQEVADYFKAEWNS